MLSLKEMIARGIQLNIVCTNMDVQAGDEGNKMRAEVDAKFIITRIEAETNLGDSDFNYGWDNLIKDFKMLYITKEEQFNKVFKTTLKDMLEDSNGTFQNVMTIDEIYELKMHVSYISDSMIEFLIYFEVMGQQI